MLADPTGKLTRGFDVMIEEDGIAMRGTFLVNPEGKIKAIDITDGGIGRDASAMVQKSKQLNMLQVILERFAQQNGNQVAKH